jgi:hypothetical protein
MRHINTDIEEGSEWKVQHKKGYTAANIQKMQDVLSASDWDFRSHRTIDMLSNSLKRATGGRTHVVNLIIHPCFSISDPFVKEKVSFRSENIEVEIMR